MAPSHTPRTRVRPLTFLLAYDEQTPPELVIPEDLTALSSEELTALIEQAVAAFDGIRGDGTGLTDDDLTALTDLRDGITALRAEETRRSTEDAERAAQAEALAAEVNPVATEGEPEGEEGDGTEGEGDEAPADETPTEGDETPVEGEETPEALAAAAGPREVRVNLSNLRSRQAATPAAPNTGTPQTMRDLVMAAPDLPGFANGQGMDFLDMARGVDRRLATFNAASYEQARKQGRHLRQQFGVAVIRQPFADDLMINSDSPEHIDTVMRRAMDETRLPGGSLVASGGWCAPSEIRYDLCELETRDGLISVPEVGIRRGGIRFTQGPDFASIFADTGFTYTEQEDIDGDYDGEGAGSKPCFKVECPDFDEERLNLAGLCITAGLLQSRGYPEAIARTIRGALIAHDHRVAGLVTAAMVAGSTAVSMPASQVGATAPILTAIGLQVEHYRNVHRMSRMATLEAVFPSWTHELIRADLARRLGLAEFDVADARIDAWFRQRGVAPQFVYNWQDLGTEAASAAVDYPTSVQFLLYNAGTWVKGGSDVITLDTVYDSVLLGTNDFTALFSEEGWLVAKMCHDSRVITVPVCPDGATHVGVAIDCDGSEGA